MDDAQILDALRGLLRVEAAERDAKVDEVVGTLPADLGQLARVRALIADKIGGTGDRHREAMVQIVAALDARLRTMSAQDELLERVAGEVWSLDRQRQAIEKRLEELKVALAAAIGPDRQRRAGRFGIKTAGLVHSLKIPSPGLVPANFTARQPDRRAILMHFRETGEVVPGTSITTRRPAVRVWEEEEGK